MSEWKETTLGKIADVQTGPFGSQLHQKDYVAEGIPIVTVEHLGERNFSSQNLPLVSSDDAKRLDRYRMTEGDVIFSRVGSVDRCSLAAVAQNGWLFSGRCLRIRPSSELFGPFLYYFCSCRMAKEYIRSIAVGTTMPSINTALLSTLPVPVPPLPTQRRIAAVLSALDDKIELNNRINANLEAQAQALFRSWFVDFEPWGGTMPEGWKVVPVANLNPILETGKRPKGGAVACGIPSIGAENVKRLGVFDYSADKYIPEEFARSLTRGQIKGYELLLYKDGGKPGTFFPHFSMFGEGFPYENCYINEHVFKLDFGDPGYNIFAYFYFQTDEIYQWLETNGMKAAIPGINQNCVLEIKIPHPGNPKIAEFGLLAKPLFKRLFKGCRENRVLAELRDTLLPKLMSGEIDVSRVEVPA